MTPFQIESLREDLQAFRDVALTLCEEDPVAHAEAKVIFSDLDEILVEYDEAMESTQEMKETMEKALEDNLDEHTDAIETLETQVQDLEKEVDEGKVSKAELDQSEKEVVALRELCAKHEVPLTEVDSIARRHA